jgi:predicted  nucleic acid-binding Zn-ribbon protein
MGPATPPALKTKKRVSLHRQAGVYTQEQAADTYMKQSISALETLKKEKQDLSDKVVKLQLELSDKEEQIKTLKLQVQHTDKLTSVIHDIENMLQIMEHELIDDEIGLERLLNKLKSGS